MNEFENYDDSERYVYGVHTTQGGFEADECSYDTEQWCDTLDDVYDYIHDNKLRLGLNCEIWVHHRDNRDRETIIGMCERDEEYEYEQPIV